MNPALAPAAIAMRARSSYTRADIISRDNACTTFWAVYTTPEGEVSERVYCFSDTLSGPRRPPGYVTSGDRYAAWERSLIDDWFAENAWRTGGLRIHSSVPAPRPNPEEVIGGKDHRNRVD